MTSNKICFTLFLLVFLSKLSDQASPASPEYDAADTDCSNTVKQIVETAPKPEAGPESVRKWLRKASYGIVCNRKCLIPQWNDHHPDWALFVHLQSLRERFCSGLADGLSLEEAGADALPLAQKLAEELEADENIRARIRKAEEAAKDDQQTMSERIYLEFKQIIERLRTAKPNSNVTKERQSQQHLDDALIDATYQQRRRKRGRPDKAAINEEPVEEDEFFTLDMDEEEEGTSAVGQTHDIEAGQDAGVMERTGTTSIRESFEVDGAGVEYPAGRRAPLTHLRITGLCAASLVLALMVLTVALFLPFGVAPFFIGAMAFPLYAIFYAQCYGRERIYQPLLSHARETFDVDGAGVEYPGRRAPLSNLGTALCIANLLLALMSLTVAMLLRFGVMSSALIAAVAAFSAVFVRHCVGRERIYQPLLSHAFDESDQF